MIAAVLFSGILFAQNTKPQLEAVGNQVKATYHYEMESPTTRTLPKRKITR
jgi:hypothetical protein